MDDTEWQIEQRINELQECIEDVVYREQKRTISRLNKVILNRTITDDSISNFKNNLSVANR